MDKRMVGQWQCNRTEELLNIFDETPLRMKVSYTCSGHYNCEPSCVYEKDGFLCWEINDEEYRMVYHVQLEDGLLKGFTTQFGMKEPIEFTRISDTPEDAPYRCEPAEQFLNGVPRIDLLRSFADYDRREETYTTDDVLWEEKPQILQKYDFASYVAQAKNPDNVAFHLLDFVCDHFHHNGSIGHPEKRRVEDVIAFCEEHQGRTNCRGLSLLLAGLLRMQGIKARHITCMPCEEPFYDCHVVVDCLLPSGKRVMLDPSWRLYLKDAKGEYVSLPHLREMLIAGDELFANANAAHNGEDFDMTYYRHYMTKNTIRFTRGTLFQDGADDTTRRRLELVPAKYPVDQLSEKERQTCVYNDETFWQM